MTDPATVQAGFSDTVLLALIGLVASSLAAILSFIATMLTLRNARLTKVNGVKSDEIQVKVDGAMSRLSSDLAVSNARLEGAVKQLEVIASDKKEALAATALAAVVAAPAVKPETS